MRDCKEFYEVAAGFVGDTSGEEISNQSEKRSGLETCGSLQKALTSDPFLVVITGRTKTGKSTLGYYVASHAPDSARPSFFVCDRVSETERKMPDEQEIVVSEFEATHPIHGFRFPAMTWVEIPDWAASSGDFGTLARSYLESADHIIYTLDFRNLRRGCDITNICNLMQAGNTLSILISRSDESKKVTVNGRFQHRFICKPEGERREQEEYVRTVLSEELRKRGNLRNESAFANILSISPMLADSSSDDLDAGFDSNIQHLYSELTEVLKHRLLDRK